MRNYLLPIFSAALLGLTACSPESALPAGASPNSAAPAASAPVTPAHSATPRDTGAMGTPSAEFSQPTQVQTLPACKDGSDSYWCSASPLTPGAWSGTNGPFADAVFSNTVCADDGYCMFGHLADGTRIDGTYYVRPEMFVIAWSGGRMVMLPPVIDGSSLQLFRASADEQNPTQIEVLHAVPSLCDAATDCDSQSAAGPACANSGVGCADHNCVVLCS